MEILSPKLGITGRKKRFEASGERRHDAFGFRSLVSWSVITFGVACATTSNEADKHNSSMLGRQRLPQAAVGLSRRVHDPDASCHSEQFALFRRP